MALITATDLKEKFTEFTDVSDSLINIAIDDAETLISVTQWGTTKATKGLAYLTAHILATSLVNSVTGKTIFNQNNAMASGGYKSRSTFDTSMTVFQSVAHQDSDYGDTIYGQMYQKLANSVFPCRSL